MEDLNTALNQILSDPGQMAKIMELAKGLSGTDAIKADEPVDNGEEIPDEKILGMLRTVLQGMGSGSDSKTALLSSMKPFLREERYLSLQRAMRLAKLARIARSAMIGLGGDSLV